MWVEEEDQKKLTAQVQFFKEHLNSGKSAEELEAEFENWYTNVLLVQEEKERIDKLTADISEESKLVISTSITDNDTVNYESWGKFSINRPCTLQAFANVVILDSFINKFDGSIRVKDSIAVCTFNRGKAEYSQVWYSVKNDVVCRTGKFWTCISKEEKYTVSIYTWRES